MEQKDLARLLGKNESEISKWITGTHNFTLKTISKNEAVLDESILVLNEKDKVQRPIILYFKNPEYIVEPKKGSSNIPVSWNTSIQSVPQTTSNYLN
jgi:transcriptional regulator with XRE-family HTH domain